MDLYEYVYMVLCMNTTCPVPELSGYSARILNTRRVNVLEKLAEDLKKEHLIVTTMENSIISGTTMRDGKILGTGIAFELFNMLQDKYHFNYSVVAPKTNVFGSRPGGVLDILKEKIANLSVAFHPVLPEYALEINYAPILDRGEWVVMMRRPSISASGAVILAPFTTSTWTATAISLVLIGPVIFIFLFIQTKLCKDDHNKTYSLPICVWFAYAAILKQGTPMNPEPASGRILLTTWWFVIIILTAYYAANLTAFLTITFFTLPIDKPEDIAANYWQWVTTKGNGLEDALIKNFSSSPALVKDLGLPEAYVDKSDKEILEEYVRPLNMLLLRERPIVEHLMHEDYKMRTRQGYTEYKKCVFVLTPQSMVTFPRAFAYTKNFNYKPLFDSVIQNLVETGIVKYKLLEKIPRPVLCPLNLGNLERILRNEELLLMWELYVGGIAISISVFIIELVVRRYQHPESPLFRKRDVKKFEQVTPESESTLSSDFESEIFAPPPTYQVAVKPINRKKRVINGTEYWVYQEVGGVTRMIPIRTPSAALYDQQHID